MARAIAPDYGQQFLLPLALEDWVPADHPVRFLREFVDALDLAALGFEMPTELEGRPPYHPSLLLKIWLYGYYHRIRATRKLEIACGEVLPLAWLTGTIKPDHNSLWRFWDANKQPLREVFKQTVKVAVRTGAVGLALQALDGTKIEAAASGYSGRSKEQMEKLRAALDRAADENELKVVEANQTPEVEGPELPAGLAQRQALREQIQQGLAQLALDGRNHYHPVEPEARRMNVSGRNRYAYNGQAVVDAKEGVVVACEVTRQETDKGHLGPMLEQAYENVSPAANGAQAQTLTLADGGFGAGADLQVAAQQESPVLVPPAEGKPAGDNPYAAQHFNYDASARTVTCPQGQSLDYEGHTTKDGMPVDRYRCHHRDCPVRALCTRDPKGRQFEVRPHTPVVQAMRQKLSQPHHAATYDQRSVIIEPRFAQIKHNDGFRRWTVWGLDAVKTQWSLLCTTLNLRILYKYWRINQSGGPKTAKLAAMPTWAARLIRQIVLSPQQPLRLLRPWIHAGRVCGAKFFNAVPAGRYF
jgi:transposase